MDRIYKLLQNGTSVDSSILNNVYEIMLDDDKSLLPYINDFIISNENKNCLGTYANNEKIITIYIDNINNQSQIRNTRLLAIEVIRHEMEHARNIKTLMENKDDIETTVIKYSLIDYSDEDNPYTEIDRILRKRINYDKDPGERIAEIKAWKYMVNLLKNQRTTEDLLIARSNLFYSYIRGYKSNGYYLDPPTYEYLLEMGMYKEYYLLKKRVNASKYIFNTRLMYGLPLKNYSEFDQEILKKVKLRKRSI